MARVICLLFSLLYVFQAFAAPLNGRVFLGRRVNAGWSDTNDQLSGRILSARASLAKINSIDSSDFQPGANSITKNHFLNAQFSLLSASRIADKVTDKIALAALNGKEPARDNAHRLILSGLSDAQNTLSTVSAFEIRSREHHGEPTRGERVCRSGHDQCAAGGGSELHQNRSGAVHDYCGGIGGNFNGGADIAADVNGKSCVPLDDEAWVQVATHKIPMGGTEAPLGCSEPWGTY
ncbi:hypothetical protein DFH09DRAFT_1077836 [Mycena vulgaris]|nr:hypothetical protein DFH09DRAFT_1077836 [Mycena vulgaris]